MARGAGRGGSLETAGVKQSFWSLLGLRPKVTRAEARNIPEIKANGGAHWPRPTGAHIAMVDTAKTVRIPYKMAERRGCRFSTRRWEIPAFSAFFVIGNVTGPRGGVCK